MGFAGDLEQFIWFTAWPPYAITHGLNPLTTTFLNTPSGANLMWNTAITLPALVLTPVTLTLGPIFSYNLLGTLALGLSAWTASIAIHRFVPSRIGSLVGGLLFGFSPYMAPHATAHLMLVLVLLLPLIVIVLHDLLVRQRWRPLYAGVALGVLVTAQLLTSEEVLAETALIAAIAVVILVLLRPRSVLPRARHALSTLGIGAGVAAVLSAFPLYVQFFGPQRLSGALLHPPNLYVNDLLNTIVPTDARFTTTAATEVANKFTGDPFEWNGYIGIPLIILIAIVVIAHRRSFLVWLTALVGVAATVLSWGSRLHVGGVSTGIPLPGALLNHVPLLNQILPARLSLFADLAWGVLVAVAVKDVVTNRRRVMLSVPLASLIVLVSLSWVPASPPKFSDAVPSFFNSSLVRSIPSGAVVLVVPVTTGHDAAPMVWQAESGMWFRSTSGYIFTPGPSGMPLFSGPDSTTSLSLDTIRKTGVAPALTADLIGHIRTDLSAWHVHSVVVGPMDHEDIAVQFLTGVLGASPQDAGGVHVWWTLS